MDRNLLEQARQVLARYGFAVEGEAAFDAWRGGFSGADVWRISTSAGPCCLRRWPDEAPAHDRIVWVHTLLRQAHTAGCRFLPLPLRTGDGATVVEHVGRHWELTSWLDGLPDEAPVLGEARLSAVMNGLAQLHLALSSEPFAAVATAPSPGLLDRLRRLDHGLAGGFDDVRTADVPLGGADLAARRDEYLRLFPRGAAAVRPLVAEAAARQLRLQPCVRDLRREHFLFVDNRLTGLVDFGAMQMDHPSIDATRAVAECAVDDDALRRKGLELYRNAVGARFADAVDPVLVEAFDRSNLLLSPYNWLRWVLVEGREFVDRPAVLRRFDVLMHRLRRLVETV